MGYNLPPGVTDADIERNAHDPIEAWLQARSDRDVIEDFLLFLQAFPAIEADLAQWLEERGYGEV